MPWVASAETVADVESATRLAQVFGGKEQPGLIDNALRSVVKYQLSRYKREVTLDKALDFRVLSDRYATVAFESTVKKAGSGRAKGVPAIYVLLFLKNTAGGLDHQMQHLLILGEPDEVAAYGTMTDVQLTALFRNAGVDVAMGAASDTKAVVPVKQTVLSGNDIKQGVVKEAFIDDAVTRDSELQQVLAGYAKKEDLQKSLPVMKANAGSPELQMRVAALEAKVQELEALLVNVTRKGGNLYFNGMNLYVNNGGGERINGKGNVIIGTGSTGRGSHNLVVGSGNRFDGNGGVVAGHGNTVDGECAVVLGGVRNQATGNYSVIAGGKENSAPGAYTSILGGSDNTAKGEFTSINGQRSRTKGGNNPHFVSEKTNE